MAPAWHADIACHRRPQSQAGQAESAGPAVLRPAKTVARRADEEKSSQAAEGCEARPRIAASRRRSHAAIPTRRSIRTCPTGKAPCRGRWGKYVWISAVAV